MESLFWLAFSLTVLALAALVRVWLSEHRNGAIVLLYHRVRTQEAYGSLTGPECNFSLTVEHFNEQLQLLSDEGYTFITPDALHGFLTQKQPLPPKAVLITFDDGCESVLRLAVPALKKYNACALVFVTTDTNSWVFEDQRRLTDDEIRELAQHNIIVGSHGVSHHGLNQITAAEREAELNDSKQQLEAITGTEVRDIALPLNMYDLGTLLSCRSANYRLIFTANPGRVNRSVAPYEVPRIAVEGQMTLMEFKDSLTPRSLAQRRVLSWIKRLPPKWLGERKWMPMRERIFQSRIGPFLHYRYLKTIAALMMVLWLIGLGALGSHVL